MRTMNSTPPSLIVMDLTTCKDGDSKVAKSGCYISRVDLYSWSYTFMHGDGATTILTSVFNQRRSFLIT